MWFTAVISSLSAPEPRHSDLGGKPVDGEEARNLPAPSLLSLFAPVFTGLPARYTSRRPTETHALDLKNARKTTYTSAGLRDSRTPLCS